jgi:pimeloyl-ACP methyl ester carboxylesterase
VFNHQPDTKIINFRAKIYIVMKKFLRAILLLAIVLLIIYLVGPEVPRPVFTNNLPQVTTDLSLMEHQVYQKELNANVKTDNEARIIWANDNVKEPTEWVLLYLHGYGASWYEGYPVNMDFARDFGCNAYFPRLAGHGLVTGDALLDLTADALWESAKEALVIAGKLGRKVLIMSSSTGGTLSLKLAAEFPELVNGLILYSPNVKLKNPAASLLSKPWGLHIARMIYKGNYRITNEDFESKDCRYWYCKQRVEGLTTLQLLIEKTMKPGIFERVICPVLLGYYYQDENHQDQTISIPAALEMFEKLGTPTAMKTEYAFPEAGDHVIACELFSGAVDEVKAVTYSFAANVLVMDQYK